MKMHLSQQTFGECVWGGRKIRILMSFPSSPLKNGQWIFTNFHYGKTGSPVNENLVSVLQILKRDRRKKAK